MKESPLIQFDSQVRCGPYIQDRPESVIKNETMFFRSSLVFAASQPSNELTQNFIDQLPSDWHTDDVILDSRVHMLMPGWWPCIPGWHLDDVPRTRCDGQPDHVNPIYRAEHAMAIVGNCSVTEFATGHCELYEPGLGQIIYKEWNVRIDDLVRTGALHKHTVEPARILFFDWQSFHRGSKAIATNSRWRWFCRVSRCTQLDARNEVRRQVNVYMENPTEGW